MFVNVFLLLALYLRVDGIMAQFGPVVDWLSGRLSLAKENNIAVWWPGFLFILLSVHAFDGYVLHRKKKPLVARGWVALSLLMMIFSVDEIGSLHERTDFYLHLGTWLSLLPFALITLAILVAAVVFLGSDPEHRKRLRPILIAFFFFGTVVIQEFLETRVVWGQWEALRVVVEEGTELLATSILLKAFMPNSFGFIDERRAVGNPVFDIIRALRLPLLAIGLFIAPVIAFATANLPDVVERGQPSDWLASTFFVFAALAVARPFLVGGKRLGLAGAGLIAVCLAASVVTISTKEAWVLNLSPLPAMNIKMLALGMLTLMAATLWPLARLYKKRIYLPAAILLAALILFSIFQTSLFMVFVIPVYLGIVVHYVNSSEVHVRDTYKGNVTERPSVLAEEKG